jgi:hypothetical protein
VRAVPRATVWSWRGRVKEGGWFRVRVKALLESRLWKESVR